MFTGIIEEIGKVIGKNQSGNGIQLVIESNKLIKDINLGESIAINGVCQTVEKFTANSFTVTAVEETLKKTNLGNLVLNSLVNLESSLTLNKKISGHFVYGHVDTTGNVLEIVKKSIGYELKVSYPKEFSKYIIQVGSVSLNGVSLTIADNTDNMLKCAIIPHTWDNTIFRYLKKGDSLNIEFDIIGKYVHKVKESSTSKITEDWLHSKGY